MKKKIILVIAITMCIISCSDFRYMYVSEEESSHVEDYLTQYLSEKYNRAEKDIDLEVEIIGKKDKKIYLKYWYRRENNSKDYTYGIIDTSKENALETSEGYLNYDDFKREKFPNFCFSFWYIKNSKLILFTSKIPLLICTGFLVYTFAMGRYIEKKSRHNKVRGNRLKINTIIIFGVLWNCYAMDNILISLTYKRDKITLYLIISIIYSLFVHRAILERNMRKKSIFKLRTIAYFFIASSIGIAAGAIGIAGVFFIYYTMYSSIINGIGYGANYLFLKLEKCRLEKE